MKKLDKIMEDKVAKEGLQWLMNKSVQCSDRYMEAETFIMEISNMSFFKRLFLTKKIIKFFESREEKYKF